MFSEDRNELHPSAQLDTRVLHRFLRARTIGLAIAAAVAAVVFCGWLVPALRPLLPAGWYLMKMSSALCVLLLVCGLWPNDAKRERRRRIEAQVCGAVVLLVSGIGLFEHWRGYTLGIDTLVAADPYAPKAPGLMSLQTGVAFFFFGAMLISGRNWTKRHARFPEVMTIAVAVVVLVVAAGQLFSVLSLYGQDATTQTSHFTLLCLIFLTFAAIVHQAEFGFFSVLVSTGSGGKISRRMVPIVLVAPFGIVGVTIFAARAGVVSLAFAGASAALFSSILFTALIVRAAQRVNVLERALRDASLQDELTKLSNRRGFFVLGEHVLLDARRSGSPLSILLFDVDDLKIVNDTQGHESGSQLLIDFATLLRIAFRFGDVTSRIGGDEFVVAMKGTDVNGPLRRLQEMTAAENAMHRQPYRISYSVGEAILAADGDESLTELVARADAQMYERKRAKKVAAV